MSCGVETEANALLTALTAGEDFEIPDSDLSGPEFEIPAGTNDPIDPLTLDQLATVTVGSDAAFNRLMASFGAHLRGELEAGRIAGNDYTKAYIALSEAAMANALGFLLGKDQAYWQSRTAQMQAITAAVQVETAKVQHASVQLEARNQEATYALTKIKLSGESVAYCTAQYNLDTMLPQQLLNLQAQKDLYGEQKTSYIRDREMKAAKLWSDAWITQKTLDDGLVPPDEFTNASVNEVLVKIKANNDLD